MIKSNFNSVQGKRRQAVSVFYKNELQLTFPNLLPVSVQLFRPAWQCDQGGRVSSTNDSKLGLETSSVPDYIFKHQQINHPTIIKMTSSKHGPISRKFNLTSKPDKLVYCRFASDSNKIYEFRLSFYMVSKADLSIFKTVKTVFLYIHFLKN